jgi:poly(A) polymerase
MIQSPYKAARSIIPSLIFDRKQFGVTAPISTNPPSERDLEMTNDLIETLREIGFFEAEEEGEKR